jgi:hypothetical protein
MKRIWPVAFWLCWLPACGNTGVPGGDDSCFFEVGDVGVTVQISQDQFFGVSIPFEATDLIVEDQVVGEVLIDGEVLSLTVDQPFLIGDTDLFDQVLDATFDGDLIGGDCDTFFLYEGVGTITFGDSLQGTQETFDIFDVTVPAVLE